MITIPNGAFVKSLIVCEENDYNHDYLFDESAREEEMYSLFYQLPHLKKLDFTANLRADAYLNTLDDLFQQRDEKSTLLLKEIEEIAVSYHLDEKLDAATAVVPHRSHETYFRLCYALRYTLTHLKIGCFGQSFTTDPFKWKTIGTFWYNLKT